MRRFGSSFAVFVRAVLRGLKHFCVTFVAPVYMFYVLAMSQHLRGFGTVSIALV